MMISAYFLQEALVLKCISNAAIIVHETRLRDCAQYHPFADGCDIISLLYSSSLPAHENVTPEWERELTVGIAE